MDISNAVDKEELKQILSEYIESETGTATPSSNSEESPAQVSQKSQGFSNSSDRFATRRESERILDIRFDSIERRLTFLEDMLKNMVIAIADD